MFMAMWIGNFLSVHISDPNVSRTLKVANSFFFLHFQTFERQFNGLNCYCQNIIHTDSTTSECPGTTLSHLPKIGHCAVHYLTSSPRAPPMSSEVINS